MELNNGKKSIKFFNIPYYNRIIIWVGFFGFEERLTRI
jgi:hypothetical protein